MRLLKKLLTVILICLFLQTTSNGQEQEVNTEKQDYFKHSLGFGAGFTTGYGLSYRYHENKFGIQVNFSPYKDHGRATFSTGLSILFTLIEAEHINFFLYQGNHFFYRRNYRSGSDDIITQYFNNGIGIGIEFLILKNVGFNIMGGYAAYEDFSKISLTGEAGLYYKF